MAQELDSNANGIIDDGLLPIIGTTGTVDNILLTANGTGGKTVQGNSAVTLDDNGVMTGPTLKNYKETRYATTTAGTSPSTLPTATSSGLFWTPPASLPFRPIRGISASRLCSSSNARPTPQRGTAPRRLNG